MQKELSQLNKLIERKKLFLERCENANTKMAITSEINIIQNFIQAVKENDFTTEINETEKHNEKLRDTIQRLEAICIIHGITDYPAQMKKDIRILKGEVLELRDENQVRVPEKLKEIIF